MTRSQRHRVLYENYAANGSALAQGVIAPGYRKQMPGPYTVPIGPPGGPLQNSSLSGPVPASFPQPKERSFPLGPISLVAIVQNTPGTLTFETDGTGDIEAGDTVTVAATGNSSVNGTYTVTAVHGASFDVASSYVLPAEIDAQGRVTVTAGA